MMLFGWTPQQWGAAKAEYFRVTGSEPARTLNGAIVVQGWWKSHRIQEPLEIRLIGAREPDVDWSFAVELFKQARCN